MSRTPRPRLASLAALFALSLISCGREITGPEGGALAPRSARLALVPQLPGAANAVDGSGDVVAFDRVRVVLLNLDLTEFQSQVFPFPAGADSIELDLSFPLPISTPATGLPLQLLLRYINAANDTVFTGGPVPVLARARGTDTLPQLVSVVLVWTGPGSNAAAVELTPPTLNVVGGTTTTFTTIARDVQAAVVPNVPVVLSTPDTNLVTFGAPGSRAVTWRAVRGTARIIASLPSGPSDTSLATIALPASRLLTVSGAGQAGSTGAPLSQPIVLRVTASDSIPVAGVTVTFSVTAGGGTLGTLAPVSDSSGLVSTTWTLGAAAGPQSISATYPGLAAPTAITATASVASNVRTWTGAASTIFSAPTNWSPAGSPTINDTLVIAAAAPVDPVLDSSVVVHGLTVEDGAALTLGDFVISVMGSLLVPQTPSVTVGPSGGIGVFNPTGGTVGGSLPMLSVGGGPYTLSAPLSIAGSIGITSRLTVTTFPLNVGDALVTAGTGALAMTGPANVSVLDADFSGGSTVGLLIGGELHIRGDFAQLGDPESFAASQSHETWFDAAVAQQVSFLNPGAGAGSSHFGTIYSAQGIGGSIVLLTDAFVNGELETGITPPSKRFVGSGQRLVSQGANADGLIFDNVRWELTDGAPFVRADTLQFQNLSPTADQFTVRRSGGALALPIMRFFTTPTTGRMLVAEDVAPADGDTLRLGFTSIIPSTRAASYTTTIGGAQILGWPTIASGAIWTGAVDTDWANAANWSGGIVPALTDSVFIAGGRPRYPVVAALDTIRTLVMASGATLGVSGSNGMELVVMGSVDVQPGAAVTTINSGRLRLAGPPGSTVRGAFDWLRVNGGTYALSGDISTDDVDIYNGDLSIGNFNASFLAIYVGLNGTFTMQGTGVVEVADLASFNGTGSVGRLTNGILRVRGNFEQLYGDVGPEQQSFSASGNHVVELVGTATQYVWFDSPDTTMTGSCTLSCFATLRTIKPAGSGGVVFRTPTDGHAVKALVAMELQGDSISTRYSPTAPDIRLIAAGRISFDTPLLRASSVAWRDSIAVRGAGTRIVDTLFAWGNDTTFLAPISGALNIVAGNHYIRSTIPGQVVVAGTLDVRGTAVIDSTFQTVGAGVLRMQDAADTLFLNGNATFAGGSTAGQLTAGVLRLGQNISSVGTNGTFAPSGTHKSLLTNSCGLCDGYLISFADTATSYFQDLETVAGSRGAGAPMVVRGNLHVNDNSGFSFASHVRVGGNVSAGPAGNLGAQVLVVGGTLNVPGGYTVPTTIYRGTSQVVTPLPYTQLRIEGTAAARADITVTDSLVISGAGSQLSIGLAGDIPIVTAQHLRTANGGALRMDQPATTLRVLGTASFAGGPTTGLLTAGRLDILGTSFAQAGGSANAFAASAGHETRFLAANSVAVSFADVAVSHFGDVEVSLAAAGAGMDLGSDIVLSGQLRTGDNPHRRITAATPRLVRSLGARADSLTFSNVRWEITSAAAIDTIQAVRFENMDPSVIQLDITGANETVNLVRPRFMTIPTGGAFLRSTGGGAGNPLVINVINAFPFTHGGAVLQVNSGSITGWNAAALFTWNGSVNDSWNVPGNWSPNAVPSVADTVIIPSAASLMPYLNQPGQRAGVFRNQSGQGIAVIAPLIITSVLDASWSGSLSCDGGSISLTNAVALSGNLGNCPITVNGGNATLQDSANVGALLISNAGEVTLGARRLQVGGNFETRDNAILRMTDPSSWLVVTGNATFGGAGSFLTLTDGTFDLYGSFVQRRATSDLSFAPQGGFVTNFVGGSDVTVSFESPGASLSGFRGVTFGKASVFGVTTNTPAFAAFTNVNSGYLTLNANYTASGSFNTFATVRVPTGVTLTAAGCNLINPGIIRGVALGNTGTGVGSGCQPVDIP